MAEREREGERAGEESAGSGRCKSHYVQASSAPMRLVHPPLSVSNFEYDTYFAHIQSHDFQCTVGDDRSSLVPRVPLRHKPGERLTDHRNAWNGQRGKQSSAPGYSVCPESRNDC